MFGFTFFQLLINQLIDYNIPFSSFYIEFMILHNLIVSNKLYIIKLTIF